MDATTVLMRSFATILGAAFLAGCGSRGLAQRDGSPVSDGSPDDAGAPRADAPRDVSAEVADAGAAGCALACGPAKVCLDGACLPAPVVLARAPGCGAARLALGGGELYWTERATGLVWKISLTGGAETPTLVASLQPGPGPITADGDAVYWSNEGDRTIRREPLPTAGSGPPDGGATAMLTAPETVSALRAGYGWLFYSAGASTYEVSRQGGVPKVLATFAACRPSTSGALAVGDGYVYQTADLLQFIVREMTGGVQLGNNPCVAADAGAPRIAVPETVSHTQGGLLLDALEVDRDQVVWADHGYIAARNISDFPQTPTFDVALSAGSNGITGFVTTGDRIFLGESDDPGGGPTAHTIQSAPFGDHVAGSQAPTATVVATDQPGARSFVTDDGSHVYWATHRPSATPGAPADCAIVSLATK